MLDKQAIAEMIRITFAETHYPGALFLQGSYEGDEPEEEVGPFRELNDWRAATAEFLDDHGGALSFFSEGGLRFFLPAFLLADLDDKFQRADPVFHLTHGFYDFTVQLPAGGSTFEVRSGGSVPINPRRYGAMTTGDYARCRLSVFTREEAAAICAYLEFKRDSDPGGFDVERLEAALTDFWRERARTAPTAAAINQHLADEAAYMAAIQADAAVRKGSG